MNKEIHMSDPFIRTYDAFSKDYCDQVIATFLKNKELGCTVRRNDGIRKDHQQEMNIVLNNRDKDSELTDIQWSEMDMRNDAASSEFFETLESYVKKYVEELGIQKVVSPTYFKNMLVQGYNADDFESYSTWHCEAGNMGSSDRAFVYTLYLNDDFEGGETEFMFQKHKEQPKQGNLVIWPAAYTHTHRGAMLLSGSKYIATGWCFFTTES